jgi:hypothetical protein
VLGGGIEIDMSVVRTWWGALLSMSAKFARLGVRIVVTLGERVAWPSTGRS